MPITNNIEISSHEDLETIQRLKQLFHYYGESQYKFGKRSHLDPTESFYFDIIITISRI